jgi:hypothetical protein
LADGNLVFFAVISCRKFLATFRTGIYDTFATNEFFRMICFIEVRSHAQDNEDRWDGAKQQKKAACTYDRPGRLVLAFDSLYFSMAFGAGDHQYFFLFHLICTTLR